jgi:hypothetical protein
MKTILITLTVFCLFACSDDDKTSGPELRDDVMLYPNGLAYDGCEPHVALNWNDPKKVIKYAPDAESVALVENFVGREGQKPGNIIYKFTGLKKTVQCGWGSKFEADEITIVSIR